MKITRSQIDNNDVYKISDKKTQYATELLSLKNNTK